MTRLCSLSLPPGSPMQLPPAVNCQPQEEKKKKKKKLSTPAFPMFVGMTRHPSSPSSTSSSYYVKYGNLMLIEKKRQQQQHAKPAEPDFKVRAWAKSKITRFPQAISGCNFSLSFFLSDAKWWRIKLKRAFHHFWSVNELEFKNRYNCLVISFNDIKKKQIKNKKSEKLFQLNLFLWWYFSNQLGNMKEIKPCFNNHVTFPETTPFRRGEARERDSGWEKRRGSTYKMKRNKMIWHRGKKVYELVRVVP